MQTHCHLIEMDQGLKGEMISCLSLQRDGCMGAGCEPVSFLITGLQGSDSPIQHIISGRLQVIS